jgi:hypothetical protein
MSVRETLESLKSYAYNSAHQALWWVSAGHIPTVLEGEAKLEHIRAHGPSPEAFTFARSFPPPDVLPGNGGFLHRP